MQGTSSVPFVCVASDMGMGMGMDMDMDMGGLCRVPATTWRVLPFYLLYILTHSCTSAASCARCSARPTPRRWTTVSQPSPKPYYNPSPSPGRDPSPSPSPSPNPGPDPDQASPSLASARRAARTTGSCATRGVRLTLTPTPTPTPTPILTLTRRALGREGLRAHHPRQERLRSRQLRLLPHVRHRG